MTYVVLSGYVIPSDKIVAIGAYKECTVDDETGEEYCVPYIEVKLVSGDTIRSPLASDMVITEDDIVELFSELKNSTKPSIDIVDWILKRNVVKKGNSSIDLQLLFDELEDKRYKYTVEHDGVRVTGEVDGVRFTIMVPYSQLDGYDIALLTGLGVTNVIEVLIEELKENNYVAKNIHGTYKKSGIDAFIEGSIDGKPFKYEFLDGGAKTRIIQM